MKENRIEKFILIKGWKAKQRLRIKVLREKETGKKEIEKHPAFNQLQLIKNKLGQRPFSKKVVHHSAYKT